ncbi:hypothetical protein [Salinibacter ruber]|uniref:hypothetical protein n=1 Tax=Salinibacter ruber TaxID=146919 RepID=UPI0020741DA8|nr:hypothetical protein [Salinibacter ruber]
MSKIGNEVSLDFEKYGDVKESCKYVFKKMDDCMVATTQIINSQRSPRKKDISLRSHQARASPFVAIEVKTSVPTLDLEKAKRNTLEKELIPDVVELCGKWRPKSEYMFFKNESAYLKKYKRMLKKLESYPKKYRNKIEKNIEVSDFYDFKGKVRPSFRKKGLMSEIGWCVDTILSGKATEKELFLYYKSEINSSISKYPHE